MMRMMRPPTSSAMAATPPPLRTVDPGASPGVEQTGARNGTQDGYYVYGVIATEEDRSFGPIGIGGRGDEVHTIRYKDLGIVVSRSPLVLYDPVRANSLAHNAVIEAVLAVNTIIPAAFGTLFRNQDDLLAFADATYHELHSALARIGDRREFGVKVFWRQEALERVLDRRPQLQRMRERIAGLPRHKTEGLRVQLGRRVQATMAQIGDRYRRVIYEHLKAAAVAARVNKPIGPRMILNGAFLVDREQERRFQQALDTLDDKYGREVRWLYTGAWAPYNFADIRVDIAPPARGKRRTCTYL